jgi:hypothetical protein
MGTQEHVYDMQAGTHRGEQEQAGAIRTDLPATARGLLRGGVTVLTSSHAGTCPVSAETGRMRGSAFGSREGGGESG